MEEMNGDLRKIIGKTNGDLRKISVYTSGDSGYNINKEVTFIWKDMYLNVKFNITYRYFTFCYNIKDRRKGFGRY